MNWASVALGVFLGAVIPSPVFWILVAGALVAWRFKGRKVK